MREKNWLSIIKIKEKELNRKKKIQKKCTRKDIKKGDVIAIAMIGIRKNREKEWFDGVCTKKRNKGLDSTITITKILYKTKVEKTIRTNSCRILEMKKTS